MSRVENVVVFGCSIQLGAGIVISFAMGDIRPALVGACMCWLGAEYLDHVSKRQVR